MRYFVLAMTIVIMGCATTSQVQTIDDRPTLAIKGVPETAVLYVDGVAMGSASSYDGKKNVLRLESGTHAVEIRDGAKVCHSEKVYLGSGSSKTITVSGG
jgi:hypothetical protein